MSARTFARSSLIRTAAALRVDEFALALRRWLVRCGQSPRMLVVEMHETPERDAHLFREQLEWASRRFTLVDLPTFARLWEEYRADPRSSIRSNPPLLFTFDDGRLNNYTVGAPMLESFGARGVFFVVPEFVQCAPQEARRFYYSRIDTRQHPPDSPDEETRSMTPEQIADLTRRGHSVGNHTYSHVNLSTLAESQLHHEIVDSAAQITSWTGKPVDAFAWTFSWNSITLAAWKLIQQHHRFCFAPCPGSVDCRADTPSLIWRTEIEVAYPAHDFRFMYAGLADPLWRSKRKLLRAMVQGDSSR
ncbi:MAG TPA: polysaccharide deacetylase family protein [Terriglobales bacterium]|nr:polysaccharide deacetylase family protein [Terriglobales bacterium]